MKVKIEIEAPEMCCDCPLFEMETHDGRYFAWMGAPLGGKCKVLPIKDFNGNVVDYQNVSTREEIEEHRRSKHCPLKEVEK